MKTNKINRKNNGFTLIEMVGVLAVIAILAALLVPKIFAAINDSRFSSTVSSLNSCKTATMDYFGKKGTFPATNTTFVNDLINANCLERPLVCKVATNAYMQILAGGTGGTGNGAFRLDGATDSTSASTTVVQCVLQGVAQADAFELSKRMDGDSLSATNVASADAQGRIAYAAADPTTVYIYVAHK